MKGTLTVLVLIVYNNRFFKLQIMEYSGRQEDIEKIIQRAAPKFFDSTSKSSIDLSSLDVIIPIVPSGDM